MELWHPLATHTVQEAYAEQPAAPVGELFRLALIEYSMGRRSPVPVPPPAPAPRPRMDFVPAESASLFSMLRGYLKRRS